MLIPCTQAAVFAVKAEPFLNGQTMVIAGHFDQRSLAYPIGKAAGGKLLTNWIYQMTVPGRAPLLENWIRCVEKDKALSAFERWRCRSRPADTYRTIT